MGRREENKMNEIIILSNKYISKDMFLNEVKISGYHFELTDDEKELWLINDDTNKACIKIMLTLMVNDKPYYYDDLSMILEDVAIPIEGIFYFVEFNDDKIINLLINQLKNNRILYVLVNDSKKFKEIK